MKNITFCLLALLGSTAAIAQPTLTASSCNPVAGDKFYRHDCDTTGITSGASGAGVTWNFAGITTMYTDSTLYAPCLGTPFCDSFPGSTLSSFDGTDYQYYIADATQFAFSGDGVSGGYCTYYPNPQAMVKFPMTYGSAQADTYFSVQPAYSWYSFGVDSMIADGYGTLVLPSGTHTNVLRVHFITYNTDSIDIPGFPFSTSSRSDYYFWFKPGFHSMLLFMAYDTSGGGGPVLQDLAYYTPTFTMPTATGISKVSGVEVYPNPAKDMLHITLGQSTPATITITDMAGRAMTEAPIRLGNGVNNLDYDVSGLPVGNYLLRVQTDAGAEVKKVTISR